MSEAPLWALPEGWCWTEAAQLIDDISAGKSFKCDERPPQQGEVGVVKVSAVTWGTYDEQESKTCTSAELVNPALFVRSGDFLFSRANTIDLVGACVIADRVTRDVMLSDKILRFSVRPGWEKWLLWALRNRHGRAEIERLATGNQDSMRNIGQSRVLSIRVPLPANGEQHRIVEAIESYFTRLDEAVATLERVERNLKRYRASVLQAAVEGRLVPTEAALARQQGRGYEPASVLLERALAERRSWSEFGQTCVYGDSPAIDTTNLPELPEGWCWSTVEQLLDIIDYRGRTPPYSENGIPHLRSSNVRAGKIVWSDLRFVSEETFGTYMTRGLPQDGDLLFTTEAPLGEVAFAPPTKFSLAQRMIILRSDKTILDPSFLYLQVQTPLFQQNIRLKKTGSGVTGISSRNLKPVPIALPPLAEQSRIVSHVDMLLSRLEQISPVAQQSVKRCARLRQSVLKWAFDGKLADQEPNDEPASVLLERIKAERAGAEPAKPARPRRGVDKKKLRA